MCSSLQDLHLHYKLILKTSLTLRCEKAFSAKVSFIVLMEDHIPIFALSHISSQTNPPSLNYSLEY